MDSLWVDEKAIQAYIHKMDPILTVMESLVNLAPQESRLVQLRAKQRNGNIVLIQHGKPIDLAIAMGVLQVKPIIFIVKTTSVFNQEDQTPTILGTMPAIDRKLFTKNTSSLGSGPAFGLSARFGFDPNWRFSSPGAYSQYLHEQGEPCTYVEGFEHDKALLRYQTITMNKNWHTKDRSLE